MQQDLRFMDNSPHLMKEEVTRMGPSSTLARQPVAIQQKVNQRPLTSKRPIGSNQPPLASSAWGQIGHSGVINQEGHPKANNEDLLSVQ